MKTLSAKELDRDYCREQLLTNYLNNARPVIYTSLKRVSSSNMTRYIALGVVSDGEYYDITYLAAGVLGESIYEENGSRAIRVNGIGMDMGFHLVYNLSLALYGLDGGYTLKHRWI